MVRSDLVHMIAEEFDLSREDADRVVSTVFGEIVAALSEGNRVELRGFGAFSVKLRGSRRAHNPRTGRPVSVDRKHVPFFKPGKRLRNRLTGRG